MSDPDRRNKAILDEANRTTAWFRARKKSPIWAKQLAATQIVSTLEGELEVAVGSFLCRGEAGDVWPQSPGSIEERYDATDEVDSEGWRKYIPRTDAQGVMAIQILHPFEVYVESGKLTGKAGDYLVKRHQDRDVAYPEDVWVVDQTLFRRTYEIIPVSQ